MSASWGGSESDGVRTAAQNIVLRFRRNPSPDVPEDVALLHLNDPNWEPPSSRWDSESTFGEKPQASSTAYSIRSSDIDSDSRSDSLHKTPAASKLQLREAEEEYEDESPYAEVRAAIANTDDPSLPVNTFRMWFIGIVMTIVMSGFNHVMSLRWPAVGISPLVIQLVTLPVGKLFEYTLPTRQFNTFGYVWSFNPGPFNIKEHTVITVMSNLLYNDAYATLITAMQEKFYGQSMPYSYRILLVLSTQLIGYAYAGMARQWLVWPASMIWPGALVECALLNTLNKNYGRIETKHMSREKFFFLVTAAAFVYYWLPGYLFTALSMFTWVCWIAPTNQTVNTLFGYQTGLGMGFLTFDWSMISYINSPLVAPWWSELNVFFGFTVLMWILAPIFYWKNVFFSKFMPISAAMAFDNTGAPYDVSQILTDGAFDVEKYRAYSPLYLPATFIISYGAQFASLTAIIVHVFLWYRHDIVRQFRRGLSDRRDVHSRLMSVYPEVPNWWYMIVGLVAFVFGVVSIEIFPTDLPVWGYILSILIGMLLLVPVGIIRAVTNQLLTTNVISEFVAGYVLPNRPIAVMLFKTYSFNPMAMSLTFVSDLKIGHYMKIPPRVLFMAQIISSIIGTFVMVAVQDVLFAKMPEICTPEAKGGFTCPAVTTFATSSLVWGAIGPQRMFSNSDALYNPILYFFLIGAIAPIPFYFLARRYPRGFWRYVNWPIIFCSTSVMPPGSGINFSSWIAVAAIFQWYMRRFHFRWWMRYNYILSAGLDAGTILCAIAIFFFLQVPKGGIVFNWWGNTVYQNTFDAMGMPAALVNPGEIFGLKSWL
ncbi:OPT oligopeptide transporter [Panus rudis PR-1116 ss-1]|nr:OPT oligopeptide transporter [Panus rudis PR-1116 ss-1]